MVAIDSSTFVAYIQGDSGADIDLFTAAFESRDVTLPSVVVSELLSEPHLPSRHRDVILNLPTLELSGPDYWVRVGAARATLIAKGLRARLPDALIAQSCIDHDVALITRDADFRHFAEHCGLKLA